MWWSVDRYTRWTSRSTLDWAAINTRSTYRSPVGPQSKNFRWHIVACLSILVVITCSLSVDTWPMYRSLPYGRMSVACRWPGGDISVYISVVYHKDATVSSPKHMLLCYQDCFRTFSEVFATSSDYPFWKNSLSKVIKHCFYWDQWKPSWTCQNIHILGCDT